LTVDKNGGKRKKTLALFAGDNHVNYIYPAGGFERAGKM